MFAVADGMLDRGWTLARANEPRSIQLMINRAHADVAPQFTDELRAAVEDARSGRTVARSTEAVYAT